MRSFVLFAPLLGVTVCFAQPALAQPAGSAAAQVCIYQDRTYSAGAAICPQARLMLTCAQESEKLIWKIVSDPALADRCTAAGTSAERAGRRRHARVRPVHTAARAVPQVAPASAAEPRCFTFNNKRYCE